jgi:predicted DNA-binding transcriptional regulator YafY
LRPYLFWTSKCKGEKTEEESKSSCYGNHNHKEDDIEGRLASHFGRDALITDRDEFIDHLKKEKASFKYPGKFISDF